MFQEITYISVDNTTLVRTYRENKKRKEKKENKYAKVEESRLQRNVYN